jgi:hypothetical protein
MAAGASEVRVFPDLPALSGFAAGLFSDIARDSVAQRGRFITALSGGGTPLALYRLLALPPFRDALPWERIHFFWGDERCVPPEDPGSNYRQAYDAWLSQVPVPRENIHRAHGELPPASAAEEYTRQLSEFASPGLDYPRFDLVLLGLGGTTTRRHIHQLSPKWIHLGSGRVGAGCDRHYQTAPRAASHHATSVQPRGRLIPGDRRGKAARGHATGPATSNTRRSASSRRRESVAGGQRAAICSDRVAGSKST